MSPELLAALRQNPSQFAHVTKARTSLEELDLLDTISKGYVSTRHEDGCRSVWVLLKMEKKTYPLMQEYWKARKSGRIDLTAHGWFWNLPDGDFRSAIRFWRQFGTLGPPVAFRLNLEEDEYSWLDLGDFWNKVCRFRAVTKTWIMLEDRTALRSTWLEFKSRVTRINEAEAFPFGSVQGSGGYIEVESQLLSELQHSDEASFRRWLETVDDSTLQSETIGLIECELNTQLAVLPYWSQATTAQRPSFELDLIPETLWSAMWYLFTLDTQTGVGPRICPVHQKLFYPPRKDRFYCTADEQQHFSKVAWWQTHKEGELRKRREARRKLKKNVRKGGMKR